MCIRDRGENARPQELRHGVDDARTADADGLGVADGEQGWLVGNAIDPHRLDSGVGGPHPVLDASTLKRRAGRTGCGDEPLAVADDHFAVGPDVDVEGDLLRIEDAGAHDARDDVAADVAGHTWEGVHVNVTAHLDARTQVHGAHRRNEIGGRNVWSHAQVLRVDTHQHAGHGGVPRGDHVRDLLALHAALLHKLIDDLVDRVDDGLLQSLPTAVSYTHLRAHETVLDLVCRLLLEKKTN